MQRIRLISKKKRIVLLFIGILLVTFVVFWWPRESAPPTIAQRLDHANMLLAQAGDCYEWSVSSLDAQACQGNFRSAAVEYRSVINMQPKNADAYMGLGEVYLNLDGKGDKAHSNFVKSLANWRKAIQLDPKSAYAHVQMGYTLDHLGQHAAANKEYRIAHRLSPNNKSYNDWLPPGARKFESDDD